MQKAGDCGDISPQFFLDFPQNFRLRTRNQYCTQAIAWGSTILDGGSTILDGGSTILDGSSTIFCWFSPFFVNFHHFLSIFTIYALLSRFTFCRDLRTFSANFFGQNSHLRNITRFLHVWFHVCCSSTLSTTNLFIFLKLSLLAYMFVPQLSKEVEKLILG